jgi:hypothetical protein
MVFHMKTTLNVDEGVMARLKAEAARQGRTMSELFEAALRLYLGQRQPVRKLRPLPGFHGGGTYVDVADRAALYDAMEGR